ncbi:MAG TPA: hypothetical protein VHN58_07240 [Croceicoccus sp.]|nr:hypothetical protein [Croceicoccus sp.]
MVAGAGLRRTGRRAALIALMALTASCEDPQPGLQDKVRVEKVVSCKDAIGHFAKTDKTRNQLCECTTARLAQQGLTMADLMGDKRDRAMEQLRWCMAQVGLLPKPAPPQLQSPINVEEVENLEASASAAPDEASAAPMP